MKNDLIVGFLFCATAFSVAAMPALASADTLTRQLEVGMSGSDVAALQMFLSTDSTLYPQGHVTGYYGFLTKSAVSNFQQRNGIDSVGRVGPDTLPVLNHQMEQGMNAAPAASISGVFVAAKGDSATIYWNTNVPTKGVVYYNTSPLTMVDGDNVVAVSGHTASTDGDAHTSQSVTMQNLQPNTTYYYLVYTTGQTGWVNVTVPATFQTTN